MWRKARLGQVVAGQAVEAIGRLRAALPDLRPTASLARRAMALAIELDHPVYDCFYLALAELEGDRGDHRPHLHRTVGMEGAFDAMWSGKVDYNWMKEHHDLYLEEIEGRRHDASSDEVRRGRHEPHPVPGE
jgi:hypothetical protein